MRKPPPKNTSSPERSSTSREDRRSGPSGRDGAAAPRPDERTGGRREQRTAAPGRDQRGPGRREDRPASNRGDYRPALNERPSGDRQERPAPNRSERPRDERAAFIRGERSGPARDDRSALVQEDRPAPNREERPPGVRAERGPDNRPNARTQARQQAQAEGRIGPHGEATPTSAPRPQAPVRALAPASPNRADVPPVKGDRLEGRNVVYEALVRGRRTVRIVWMDVGARSDDKIDQILAMAGDRVKRVERTQLDRMSLTGVHNGVIAEADEMVEPTVRQLLGAPEPFLVLVDEVQYEHNLGAVLRSALGAGVDGVIIPTQRGKGLTPIVQRVSMGGAEAVPVVRAGISASLAEIQRAGVRVIGADMNGTAPWDLDLTGPIAFVLGGEDKGLTAPVRKRCDAIAGIPLAGNLQSLNVSVTAGILLFERVRQMAELAKRKKG